MNFCIAILKAFYSKLLSLKELNYSRNEILKKKCIEAQCVLESITEHDDVEFSQIPCSQLLVLILPAVIAIKSSELSILMLSLDSLQKLLSHRFLERIALMKLLPDSTKPLSQEITEILLSKFKHALVDSNIELALVKTIQPMVVVDVNEVHGMEMTRLVKMGLLLLSSTSSPQNQPIVFAALSQMVASVFQRVEGSNHANTDLNAPPSHDSVSTNPIIRSNVDTLTNIQTIHEEPPFSTLASTDSVSSANGDRSNEEPCEPLPPKENYEEPTSSAACKETDFTEDSVSKSQASFYRHDRNFSCGGESKCSSNVSFDMDHSALSDALCLYTNLCKSAIHPITLPTLKRKLSEVRYKKYILELVSVALFNANETFRLQESFMEVTRKHLFITLTESSITQHQDLFRVCINVFLLLVSKFRSSLKLQIQVFFEDILFNILEASSILPEQVLIVLKEFKLIFKNAKAMHVLFVNYDCDIVSHDVFERLIDDICCIAKYPSKIVVSNSHTSASSHTSRLAMEHRLRLDALRCLFTLLDRLYVDAKVADVECSYNLPPTDDDASPGKVDTLTHSAIKSISSIKERKELLQQGISLFSIKPVAGISFLQEHNFIEMDPASVARFLHEEDRLDMNKIGDLLGMRDEYWIQVMHQYVEQVNVTGMDFLEAIRLFLLNFRLPGESQQIDRMMEKFAGHYYNNNCNTQQYFKNADVCYVLAYSIIILTTDLHNPQVRRKISHEQYVNMNRNPDNSLDLPEEYLISIYDSILKKGIQLRPTTNRITSLAQASSTEYEKKDDTSSNVLMAKIAKSVTEKFEQISAVNSSFVEVESAETAKFVFSAIWKHLFVCFTCVLQEVGESSINHVCLLSIRICTQLSCIYGISLARDAFIKSLISFSMLSNNAVVSEMKSKNLDAARTLLTVAREVGNYLESSWIHVLQCVSNLEIAQNDSISAQTSSGQSSGASSFDGKATYSNQNIFTSSHHETNTFSSARVSSSKLLTETSSQSILVLVDHLFTSSVNLNADSIIHFISSLCHVSKQELSFCNKRRTYSLQKIVEVAYYNMNRSRFEWSRIWGILGPYFIQVATMEDTAISLFCVDSLRQLSIIFLEREEFANFHFQADFLKPFENIMTSSGDLSVKELVVRCIFQMVQSQSSNIKSGWEVVFNVLNKASTYQNSKFDELALQTMKTIVESSFHAIADCFDVALNCIKVFSCRAEPSEFSVKSVHLLGTCFEKFREYVPNSFNSGNSQENRGAEALQEWRWQSGWLPIIYAMVEIIRNTTSFVRVETLLLLFSTIRSNNSMINTAWWPSLFNVLNSIFDVIRWDDAVFSRKKKAAWITESCTGALMGTLELYIVNYDRLPSEVTVAVLSHLEWCMNQDYEVLGTTAIFSLRRLFKLLHHKFDSATYEIILKFIKNVLASTTFDIFRIAHSDVRVRETEEMVKTLPLYDAVEARDEAVVADATGNNKQESWCNDYSCYSTDMIRSRFPLMAVERENAVTEPLRVIHGALTGCRMNLEFLDMLKGLLEHVPFEQHVVGSKEAAATVAAGADSNPEESMIFHADTSQYLELLSLLRSHHDSLKRFNTDEGLIESTAKYIEIHSPSISVIWKGKVKPRMILQETMVATCILRALTLYCTRLDFEACCYDVAIPLISVILQRCPDISGFSGGDAAISRELLTESLSLLCNLPEGFFKIAMKSFCHEIWPLIRLKRTRSSTELLCRIYSRLDQYIHGL